MKYLSMITAVCSAAMFMVQAAPVPQDVLKAVDEVAVSNGLHPRQPLYLLEQFVPAAAGDAEQRKQLAGALMDAFASDKTSAAGRTIVAQHLAKVAGEAEIQTLRKMKGDAQTMADIRIALNEVAASSIKDAGKPAYLAELKSGIPIQQIAGLAGIAQFYPNDAAEISLQSINSKDSKVSSTAIRTLAKNNPSAFAVAIPAMSKERQLMALTVASEYGITEAGAVAAQLAQSDDADLKSAAVQTLGSIGSAECVAVLVSEGAEDALVQLNAKGVDKAILKIIGSGDAVAKERAINASVMRGIPDMEPVLLKAATDANSNVSAAALKFLGRSGSTAVYPQLTALLGSANSEEVASSLRRIIKRMDDKESCFKPLLKIYGKSGVTDTEQIAVLRCLSSIGGEEPLVLIAQAITSSNKEVNDAAVRALAQWPDPSVMEMLKKMVADKNLSVVHRTL